MTAQRICNRLFGSCGVRGVVGEFINDELIARLARAFAYHLGPDRRICIGRDTRSTGPMLEEKMVSELAKYGLDITRLGVVSTPALYFLTRELGFDAGIMVTASHNPDNYNGYKFCDSQGMCADQEAIEHAILTPPPLTPRGRSRVEQIDGARAYFAALAAICPPPIRPMRLVVDCACGPLSAHLPDFLRRMGHDVIEINCIPDLTQCNRLPEPMESTLGKTIQLVHESDADGGLCFDGDSDRVVFLDRQGMIPFQHGNAIVARMVLEPSRDKRVVGTVETGRFVEAAITLVGGSLLRTVVGDVNVARVVKQKRASVGVEECGHYIIPRFGYFSSTVFPATLLLAKYDLNDIRPSLAGIPKVLAADRRLDCAEEDKQRVMRHVAKHLRKLGGRVTAIDGVRVDWEDGWLLVRPSGTSPYMKVNAEAFTPERLEELVSLGVSLVQEALG